MIFCNTMKTLCFTFCIILFQGSTVFAQGIFPKIPDNGSNTGSSSSTATLFTAPSVQDGLRKAADEHGDDYVNRMNYLIASSVVNGRINGRIDDAIERYNALKKINESLNFFAYSKKRINKELLENVEKFLDNMEDELDKQDIIALLGEKLNLYGDTAESLYEIHRTMDEIEDNIENTWWYEKLNLVPGQ